MPTDWRQIAEDFRQKYRNTYVHVAIEGNKKRLFYVRNVTYTDGPPEIELHNPDTGTVILKYDGASDITFDYPELGYFAHEGMAYFLSKRVDRQYSRGFGDYTCILKNPYDTYVAGKILVINFQKAQAAHQEFFPPTLSKAASLLRDEDVISIPLTREFCLGQDPRAGVSSILWWKDIPVGIVNTRWVNQVTIKESIFRQEIEDYIKTQAGFTCRQ